MEERKVKTWGNVLLTSSCFLLILAGLLQLVLAQPYINLPTDPVTVKVDGPYPCDCYFKVTLSNVPGGYDVTNGVYLGWCCDTDHTIPKNTEFQAYLYSSYASNNPFPDEDWDKVNYIINHKIGDCHDVQEAIWCFIDHLTTPTRPNAIAMVKDANANGEGFVPEPCNYIAIVVDVVEVDGKEIQHLFFELHIPRIPTPEFGESISIVTSMAGVLLLFVRRTFLKGNK